MNIGLQWVALIAISVVVAVWAWVSARPKHWHIVRRRTYPAPAHIVYAALLEKFGLPAEARMPETRLQYRLPDSTWGSVQLETSGRNTAVTWRRWGRYRQVPLFPRYHRGQVAREVDAYLDRLERILKDTKAPRET